MTSLADLVLADSGEDSDDAEGAALQRELEALRAKRLAKASDKDTSKQASPEEVEAPTGQQLRAEQTSAAKTKLQSTSAQDFCNLGATAKKSLADEILHMDPDQEEEELEREFQEMEKELRQQMGVGRPDHSEVEAVPTGDERVVEDAMASAKSPSSAAKALSPHAVVASTEGWTSSSKTAASARSAGVSPEDPSVQVGEVADAGPDVEFKGLTEQEVATEKAMCELRSLRTEIDLIEEVFPEAAEGHEGVEASDLAAQRRRQRRQPRSGPRDFAAPREEAPPDPALNELQSVLHNIDIRLKAVQQRADPKLQRAADPDIGSAAVSTAASRTIAELQAQNAHLRACLRSPHGAASSDKSSALPKGMLNLDRSLFSGVVGAEAAKASARPTGLEDASPPSPVGGG